MPHPAVPANVSWSAERRDDGLQLNVGAQTQLEGVPETTGVVSVDRMVGFSHSVCGGTVGMVGITPLTPPLKSHGPACQPAQTVYPFLFRAGRLVAICR